MKKVRGKDGMLEDTLDASPPWPQHSSSFIQRDAFIQKGVQELRRYLKTRWGSAERAFVALDAFRAEEISPVELEESFLRLRVPWSEIFQALEVDQVFQIRTGRRGLDIIDIMGHPDEVVGNALEDDELGRTVRGPRSASNSPRGGTPRSGATSPRGDVAVILNNKCEAVASEQEEVRRFADWASRGSHWDSFHELFHETDAQSLLLGGVIGRRNIELQEFTRACRSLGYHDHGIDAVFDLIQQECKSRRQERNEELGLGEYPGISLRQLKRFQVRIERMSGFSCSMVPPQEVKGAINVIGCPHERFGVRLEKMYGTRLRGWRMALDKHQTGLMSYPDFAKACRSMSIHGQIKQIWQSLHKEGSAETVEFDAIAPEEAANVQNFAEFLWKLTGLDCDKAWRKLDVYGLGKMDMADFRYAVERLGFVGDASLIFKGLDEQNLGHIYANDLHYIKRVSKFSRKHFCKGNMLVHSFIEWAQANFDGPEGLIQELQLDGRIRDLSVAEFAARLEAFGFQNNALSVASRLARKDGGTNISVDTLFALLRGGGHKKPFKTSGALALPSRAHVVEDRPPFDNKVYIFSEQNDEMCAPTRKGFSKWACDAKFVPRPASASRAIVRRSPNAYSPARTTTRRSPKQEERPRPAWTDSMEPVSMLNPQLPANLRTCFNDFADRPVREEMRKKLQERYKQAQAQPQQQSTPSPESTKRSEFFSRQETKGPVAGQSPQFGRHMVQERDDFDYDGDGPAWDDMYGRP